MKPSSNPLAPLLVDTLHRLREAQCERDAYRLLARAGIHHAHAQQIEIGRLRVANRMLRDEVRAQYSTERVA